jgi:PBS lyase HEAT-like repeat
MSEMLILIVCFFALCGAGTILSALVSEKSAPAVLAWVGSVASLVLCLLSIEKLLGGQPFELTLWTLPGLGCLTLAVDSVSVPFVLVTGLVFLASSVFSRRYLARYSEHFSLRAFAVCYHVLLATVVVVLLAGDALLFLIGWEVMSSRSGEALMALLALGRDSVPALVGFLRSTKPSSLPEGRLLAVEGLSILKGPAALAALIVVATQSLANIRDPAVRLGEETVASRAASALADFPDPHAREALLELLNEKPLIGVAEAFEKLGDPRAIPRLVSWLGEDFVAEAAGRAIVVCGCAAVPALLDSLRAKDEWYGSESGKSQRRRARALAG